MNDKKVKQLDCLQKGLMQQAFFIFVVLVWIAITLSLARYFYILESPRGTMAQIIGIAEGIIIGLVLLYLILPWITWTMFTKTQKLEQAIEADYFFQRLDITAKERLHYIKQNKLDVFIAEKPLNEPTENNIKAAYFYFLTRFLPIKTNWYVALGQKRACFDMAQAETLIDLTELEIRQAKGLNEELQSEITQLKRELKSVRANLARDTKLARQDMLFWVIGIPMLAEMIAEGRATGAVYTKADIENYFQKFSAAYPNEVAQLQVLLNAAKVSDIRLPKHIQDTIANELDENDLKQGHGRPKN